MAIECFRVHVCANERIKRRKPNIFQKCGGTKLFDKTTTTTACSEVGKKHTT